MSKNEEKSRRPIISKLIFLILIVSLIYLYARYVGTTGIKVREYNVVSSKISESFDGFKIVQFSDMELGSTFFIDDIDYLVDTINKNKPDIVLFTGDMIAKKNKLEEKDRNLIVEKLNKIDSKLGVYYVRGDDDVNDKDFEEIIKNTHFIDLSNRYELVYYKDYKPIIIYGLDSSLKAYQDLDSTFKVNDEDSDELFSILMVHEPDTTQKVKDKNLDLILSGHSHNSEINIPYLRNLYNIKGAKEYYDSMYDVNNTKLYISSGLGTSHLHVRLFSRPSISVFKLYNK